MNTLSTKMTSTFSDSKTFTNELQKKMTTNNVESVSPNTITADTSATPVNAGSLGKEEEKDSDVSTEKFPIFLVFGLFVGVGSCLVVVGYILYHGKQRKDKFDTYNPPKPSPSLTQSQVHDSVSDSEQEMSTADIMNWGDVEMNTNPMRKKQASSKTTIQKDAENAPPGVVRCKLQNTVKGSLLFITSTVVIGFFYILSQQVATSAGYIHVRYWSRVDSVELMFYLFVLSAILHFIINAGGGSRFKYWSAFVPIMLITVAVLVGVAPNVYQPVNETTENIAVDRAGCSSVEELDKKYKMSQLCPLTRKDRFLRYDFVNRTEEDVRVLVSGIDVLGGLGSSGMLTRYTQQAYPRMVSFVNEKCSRMMMDIFCADLFRECNVMDCNPLSNDCHITHIMELVREWSDCGRQECTVDQSTIFLNTPPDPNWCRNINEQAMVDHVIPRTASMIRSALSNGNLNEQTQHQIDLVLDRVSEYVNQTIANTLGSCAVLTDKDSNASMSENVTCNITIQTYARTTRDKQFNSTLMMSLVFAIFSCSVMLLGHYETFHFHFSTVRVGSCIVGLFTSSLVYIGSLHLYWSSRNNPLQNDADVQMAWRAFYLVVSYVCLHFGLLVIVPAAEVVVDEKKKHSSGSSGSSDSSDSSDSSAADHQDASPSCCLNTLYSIKSIKEQFWDPSGE